MELLEGFDADKMVKTYGPMPASRVVHVMLQVCRSLAEAHALQLVHRDVKPANIFLARIGDEFDIVKVLDFGLVYDAHKSPIDDYASAQQLPIAQFTEPEVWNPAEGDAGSGSSSAPIVSGISRESLHARVGADLTQAGAAMGTPTYMAPEQVLGHTVTAAADVYALGCLMIFLLTRRTLFRKPDATSAMMAHVVEPVPDFESWAEIPAALAKLIRTCLEKSPDARPRDAAALLEQLEAVASVMDAEWTTRDAREAWAKLELPNVTVDATAQPERLVIDAAG
jgi:eukaryotic-like serine/threonine-protein kinase